MLEFKEIELKDKEKIDSMICASGCHGADYSFTNLFIWRKEYNPRICFVDERLVVFMPDYNLYAYPKGGDEFRNALESIVQDAKERGIRPVVIRGLTEATMPEFLSQHQDDFEISDDRDNADYIYSIEKLRYLKGRKLSGKRNHIKHFEANGEWELRLVGAGEASAAALASRGREGAAAAAYTGAETAAAGALAGLSDSSGKPIGTATIDDCKAFLEEYNSLVESKDLEAERVALGELFDNYEALGCTSALLYQNGRPVAFTAGTMLGKTVYDVHFEKARPDVEAAYTMINREFANLIAQLIPEIEYFNREEDMGLPGLRRAKESYYPDMMIYKYIATEKI